MNEHFEIKPLDEAGRQWVDAFITRHWAAETVVVHGDVYRPAELPGFAALVKEVPVGLLTYHIKDDACEVVTMDSLRPRLGIGYALLDAVLAAAWQAGCRRVWLVTTNDNTMALRFYQRYGFLLCALRCDAVAASRRLKPAIPMTGLDGIPIRDEIEMEIMLNEQSLKPRFQVNRAGGSQRHPYHGCN